MLQLKRVFYCSCLLVITTSIATGHGVPINAYVDSETGQLAVFDGYEYGELESFGGSDIFTDAPGIGVSSTFNGIAVGESLHLNVTQGLLFWDGTEVRPTEETLIIDWPDDGGSSPVDAYEISAQTGYQTGMLWGVYQPPSGTGSWDAHGDYALDSLNPPPGVYGVVLQLDSASYVASEPFLVPLLYDPLATYGANQIDSAIDALQMAILPLPTADFNRDTIVDQEDLATWEAKFGEEAALVHGDATGDGHVAGDDYLAWQLQFNAATPVAATFRVPEPSTLGFVVFAAGTLACQRRRPNRLIDHL